MGKLPGPLGRRKEVPVAVSASDKIKMSPEPTVSKLRCTTYKRSLYNAKRKSEISQTKAGHQNVIAEANFMPIIGASENGP